MENTIVFHFGELDNFVGSHIDLVHTFVDILGVSVSLMSCYKINTSAVFSSIYNINFFIYLGALNSDVLLLQCLHMC